jgi:hypothetical protein
MRLACVIAALLVASSPFAHADEASSYRAVVDRIDVEPSAIGGHRLRVYLSVLSLRGQRIDLTDPKALEAVTGSSELRAPYALGSYAETSSDTAIVVVVQSTIEFADVLAVISQSLDQTVLAELGERTQVAILPYGGSVPNARLLPVKQARGKLTNLATDGSAGEPLLLDTLERALRLLKRAKTEPEGRPIRKMILAIGDGRDLSGDRDRVTRLGTRAAREGVRIHSFAFSPNDVRRPLLLLGELSKRSLGTFRWLRTDTSASWTPAFQQLLDEINRQYVLTYFLPAGDEITGRKLKIITKGRVEVTSNELKVPPPECNGEPCENGYCADRCVVVRTESGRGVFGWILMIGGIVAGALLVLGVIGYFLTRRQQQQAAPFPPGAFPPSAFPPAGTSPAAHVAHQVPSAPPMAAAAPPMAAAAPPSIAGPRLYVMSGPLAGQTLGLRHGFTIGKAPGCDLQIDDGYTSGQHAQIGMDHFGNCRLYDRGSTNGSFVNGVRVTEYALEHGNTVKIGSTELRFLVQ